MNARNVDTAITIEHVFYLNLSVIFNNFSIPSCAI